MLRLLADENIPKKLATLLKKLDVDIIRLQDLGLRGISDKELINVANEFGRAILTRDSDLTIPSLLSLVGNGVIYVAYQPSRGEIPRLAERIASIVRRLGPRPGLLVVVGREHIEVYG